MEITAKVMGSSGLKIAGWRNEGVRPLFEEKIPALKGWDLSTLNAKVVSPSDLNIRGIRTVDTYELRLLPTFYYCNNNFRTFSSNDKPCAVGMGAPDSFFGLETMRIVPMKFKIENKMPSFDNGFLYIPSGSEQPEKGILELMSREKLRAKYGVADGDKVIISLDTH
jgi:hypothetical protein